MVSEKRLIDANALYEKVERIYLEHYEKSSYKFIHDFFRAMFRRINNAPTVDAVEVVHGRWEFKQNKECSWCTDLVCTACNTVIDSHVYNRLEYRQEVIKKKLLYCPNCGADMRERKEYA